MGGERFFDGLVMGYDGLCIGIGDEHWLDCCIRMLITVFYRYLGEWGNLGECRAPNNDTFLVGIPGLFRKRLATEVLSLKHSRRIYERD